MRKVNVHLCGLCLKGRCEYISYYTTYLRGHIAKMHPDESISIVRVVGYPGQKPKNYYNYVAMTHAELYQKDRKLAKRVIDLYYGFHCTHRVHLCGLTLTGECDYAYIITIAVRNHLKKSFRNQGVSFNLQNNRVS